MAGAPSRPGESADASGTGPEEREAQERAGEKDGWCVGGRGWSGDGCGLRLP